LPEKKNTKEMYSKMVRRQNFFVQSFESSYEKSSYFIILIWSIKWNFPLHTITIQVPKFSGEKRLVYNLLSSNQSHSFSGYSISKNHQSWWLFSGKARPKSKLELLGNGNFNNFTYERFLAWYPSSAVVNQSNLKVNPKPNTKTS